MQLLVIWISTVWHSGTHSLMDRYDSAKRSIDWEQRHCCSEIVEYAKAGQEIHTTFRDPWHVAISWANRGRIYEQEHHRKRTWFAQWAAWRDLIPYAIIHPMEELGIRLNTHADSLDLYPLLDAGEWNKLYKVIPKEMIDFALECAGTCDVHKAKFVEIRP